VSKLPDTAALDAGRRRTDDSLRVEREKADAALGDLLAASDETADAIITRARARADEVLALARAKSDREPVPLVTRQGVERERGQEDTRLQQERTNEDETLREERADLAATLSAERQETDHDLLSERNCSDSALGSRSEFLRIVSHELRSLVTAMGGYATLIETEVPAEMFENPIVGYALRIRRIGARMDRLIGDLLDIAGIDAGRLALTREVGDATKVIQEAVDTFQAQASKRGISVVAEVVGQPPLATLDPARILQVLTNLISNAIKFSPADGTVVVRVEQAGDALHFRVTDTGPGVPEDKLEAVFERFFQVIRNDRRGLGLGLYISRCIVQGHGGRIWAESRVGEGSTFHFTVPIQPASRRA
jgi:signal transduction histidine kinase